MLVSSVIPVARSTKSLIAFAGGAVFSESAFYAALAPMLPSLESELGLSQAAAGILGAAYPAGIVLATIPAGFAADRIGPRVTARVGVAALALASVGFGLGETVAVVDTARLVQGAGTSAAWAGSLTWLALASNRDRRGAMLGSMIAAAFAGTVVGPAVGVAAASVGRGIVFLPLALLLAALAIWGGPRFNYRRHSGAMPGMIVLRDTATLQALLLMVLVGVLLGGILSCGALFLSGLGVGTTGIAAVFMVGYGSQAVLTPFVGRQIDQSGPLPAISIALASSGLALALTPLVSPAAMACLFLALATSASLAAYTPAAVLISRIADQKRLSQGLPMALTNGSWGVGAAFGAAVLNVLAEAHGDVAAFGAAATFCLVGLVALARPGVRARFSV